MTSKEKILSAHYSMGRTDALALRSLAVAGSVTDTEIIAREYAVPPWRIDVDYADKEIDTPVAFDGQVYGLRQPHTPAHYPDTDPSTLPALWRIIHTQDPAKAKPFLFRSTADLYMTGDCCTDPNAEDPAQPYRAKQDNVDRAPSEWPDYWEAV